MKDLTIIIPIIELNDNEKKSLFSEALTSAKQNNGPIFVVGSSEAIKSVGEELSKDITLLENTTGVFSYPAQVNFAAKQVKTKYFSVLEYDDIFTSIWFNNAEKYINEDADNIFAYLPLTEIKDYKLNQIIGYSNEAFWASSFSNNIGFMDSESIDNYFNFNTSGGIFQTEYFNFCGGLKSSMKLVFWYEFLLRVLHKDKKVFIIPKVGYIHTVNRDNSMSEEYAKNMTEKEADWWIELAKKEYFFPQDRNKTYIEE